ncbi:DeoR/GlpR transcriptional regulator [Salmonella enterica]|uniref:DeoR family transcriptional regulator n=1 Tax=Salmonella enterica TaxID=28901 RepID=A0A629K8L9_SALER|nr:DeoR/GlpR transcriptional regulator [Salmonella enterica]EBV5863049.1 DeoR/GlpR transcriptional regulator [Salmonella enterica subsp. enterica serovar Bere]ECI0839897.1 DeoR/GlpR transcriptional regulator [Salmonella enterica subsp. diarizonae]MCH5483272.1 DeoR/GlpR family DNA-binding transcription regulator [Salmonella enterica subsp. diarizonae serovar 16:z10:e,n,x,z15]EBC7334597.1 DeoR/GlpR transcriptional regulator [Salmonella enterica]
MIPAERRQIILGMVAEKGIISIAELTDRMNVSHMTIRRDLQTLEQQGTVALVSGGVQLSGRVAHEPSHQMKTALAMMQKTAIGKLAASLIQPGSCIYLDAGTTTLAIAQHLVKAEPLTVVTNDFVIADYLLDNSSCTIIHTGGAVCRENRSCVGEAAATMLRGLMIDQAFISASSWSVRGISTPAEDKVSVKRAVASASRQRILVCDATKYGQVATWLALPLNTFDKIITDDGLSDNARAELEKEDASLLMVNADFHTKSLRVTSGF